MKIAVYSNFFNHHQRPLSEALRNILGTGFIFVETEPISQERLALGWKQEKTDYTIQTYEDPEKEAYAKTIALDADAIIIGSAPDEYMVQRLKKNKLTFRYAERFYKQGLCKKNILHAACGAWLHHGRFQKYPLYMLCASAYTAWDCSIFGNYKNRTYKWGYFTELKKYDIEALFAEKSKNERVSILWAGRFLDLKHPEAAVLLAEQLRADGYEFELNIIGSGDLEQQLRDMISEKQLSEMIHMLGSMKPEEVRRHMERADIFLFTSDFNEGWGAVLNEAMNSGCAVVASHAIGSVPFLVKHRENGVIYRNGDQEALHAEVRALLDDPQMRKSYGANAYKTILETWNAEVAAERFIKMCEEISAHGSCDLFEDGPCSRAPVIKNNWFDRYS